MNASFLQARLDGTSPSLISALKRPSVGPKLRYSKLADTTGGWQFY